MRAAKVSNEALKVLLKELDALETKQAKAARNRRANEVYELALQIAPLRKRVEDIVCERPG